MTEVLPFERITRAEAVERALLEKIAELAGSDGRLPTEAELARLFNVSRGTIRSAVGALAGRGYLVRRQGIGTFVNQAARITNPFDQAIDFVEIISRNGCRPGIRYISTAITDPDAGAEEALHTAGMPVLERHTIFTADDEPVIYCVNHIPISAMPVGAAEAVVANPEASEPIYEFLESRCGQRVEFHAATLWPELAQHCMLREQICDPLTPVLVVEETGFNSANQPVLHSLEYYPGRFMRFDLVRRRVATRSA